MIIPLAHDQLTLRRWPIVSFAIIGLCWAAFIAGGLFGAHPDPKVVEKEFDTAVDYYLDHPYLETDPRLREAVAHLIARQEPGEQHELLQRLQTPHGPRTALDDTRQQRLDELTKAWIATSQVGPLWDYGLIPARPMASRFLTSLFIHAGFLHILFNMLFLYLSGPSLEDVWGRPIFAGFYLAAGVASALCFVGLYPQLAIPLVGASGAIAGLMGAFFVRYPTAQIRIFYMWMLRVGTTTIPAWFALLFWVLGELFSAYLTDQLAPGSGGAGVAHWGHVSGFAFGAVFALGARAVGLEERVEPGVCGENRVWRQANRALERDDPREAWRLLREQTLRDPADVDAALAYWNVAEQLGRSREAAPVVLRLIRSELQRDDPEAALRLWDELKERVPDAVLAVDLAVKLAEQMLARQSRAEAADLLRDAFRHVDAATSPQILADLALTAVAADEVLAAEAATRALAHPGLPRAARAELERLVGGAPVERVAAR